MKKHDVPRITSEGFLAYTHISEWKSKGFSDESTKCLTSSSGDKILSPRPNYVGTKARVKFKGSFLKQDKIIFNHRNIVNIYIVYEITKNNPVNSYPMLENCLFGPFKLTKNPDTDKNKFSGHDIGFDKKGNFSFGNGFGQNVINFGAGMSSFAHANDKKRSSLVLGEGFTRGLDDKTLYAEKA